MKQQRWQPVDGVHALEMAMTEGKAIAQALMELRRRWER